VIGRNFLYRLLQAISEAETQLDQHLAILQRVDLVREKTHIPELEYIFKHSLTQEAAYNSLLVERRREFHRLVGEQLEILFADQIDEYAAQLAHHFQAADDYARAFHYFSMAGKRATGLYATGEAIKHYTQAIKLAEKVSPDVVSLAELHRERGLASEILGDFEGALLDHTTALQIAQEAGERQVEWHAIIDLGKLWRSRDYDQARNYFETAMKLARQMNDATLLADSLNWIGNWYANADQSLQAVEYHLKALKIVEQGGNKQKLANTLDLLGIASLLGSNCEASVQYYNQAIALFRELDNHPRLATSLLGRAANFSMLELLVTISAKPPRDPAIDFDEAYQIATEINSAPDQAWARWAKGSLLTRRGQFGQALENLKSGLQIALEIGHREFVAANRFGLGDFYNTLLVPEKAQPQLEEALALTIELNSQNLIHEVTGALAKTYILLNDFMAAQTCLEAVLSTQTPMDTLGIRYCWVQSGELTLAQGNSSHALDIAERLIASTPGISPGRVILLPWKLKGEALAALGNVEEGISLLRAAKENAQDVGERFFLWQVLASLGRLYTKMEDQDAAEREFSAARALIDELAATILDDALKENFLQRASHSLG
jgi:tetratricopeptide (TPR) repeat protein